MTAPETAGRGRRIAALVRKESLQILRDPSSYLIAGLLPLLLLVIFGYGVSLDLRRIPVARGKPAGQQRLGHPANSPGSRRSGRRRPGRDWQLRPFGYPGRAGRMRALLEPP